MFKLSWCKKQSNVFQSIINGDFANVQKYFKSFPYKLNEQNEIGETALFLAIKHGQNEIGKYLLFTKNADINIRNNNNESPLWIAANKNNVLMLRLLLSINVPIININYDGITPLQTAIIEFNMEIVKILLKEDIVLESFNNRTPLHLAASTDNIEAIDFLLKEGYNIDAKNDLGNTALHIAVKSNKYNNVVKLIENGASLKIINNNSYNPIELANLHHFSEIENYLKSISEQRSISNIKRKRKILLKTKFNNSEDLVPSYFCCPISMELFVEPVIASDGHTYEKSSIEKWVGSGIKKRSPMTNQLFLNRNLIPNYNINSQIQNYVIGQ